MVSRRPPITAVEAADFRGRVCVVTGGRCGRRCRFGTGPPGLRDGLRPSLRRGRAHFRTPRSPVVRGAANSGLAVAEIAFLDRALSERLLLRRDVVAPTSCARPRPARRRLPRAMLHLHPVDGIDDDE